MAIGRDCFHFGDDETVRQALSTDMSPDEIIFRGIVKYNSDQTYQNGQRIELVEIMAAIGKGLL